MRKLFIPILLFLYQFTNGQEITKDFKKQLYLEDFNAISANVWPNSLTDDNIFVMQNGGYELFRQNKSSGYYLFSQDERSFDAGEFTLEASFKKHKNKRQSIGIMLMTQSNFTGGIIVEISPKHGYRIQKIDSRGPKSLTGDKDGWVKSKNITKSENVIKIKTYQKVFDLYINGKYEYTFSELQYYKGGIGIFIGPNSKAKVTKLSVYGDEEIELGKTKIKTDEQEEKSLAMIIVRLQNTIKEKDKEIYELQKNKFVVPKTQIDTAARRMLAESNEKVKSLESDIAELKYKIDANNSELENLRNFKKDIEKSGGGDIVITLSNILDKKTKEYNEEKSKNTELDNKNAQLKVKLDALDLELKRVSETNILLREVLKQKQEEIDSKKKNYNKDEDEEGDEIGNKNDLLNELLRKEKEERIKKEEKKNQNWEEETVEELDEVKVDKKAEKAKRKQEKKEQKEKEKLEKEAEKARAIERKIEEKKKKSDKRSEDEVNTIED